MILSFIFVLYAKIPLPNQGKSLPKSHHKSLYIATPTLKQSMLEDNDKKNFKSI